MNSKIEECIGRFVQDVRRLSSYEAVYFELGIGSSAFTVNVKYRTPSDLERDGISMRNLNGDWIRASEKRMDTSCATLQSIVDQLAYCDYKTSDGLHELKMNAAFLALKERAAAEDKDKTVTDHG